MGEVDFEKIYTRDFSMIIVESWAYALTDGFHKKTGFEFPQRPVVIYHYLNGAIEQWHAKGIIHWLKDKLVETASKNPAFLSQELDDYEKQIRVLQPVFAKGTADSEKQLRDIVSLSPDTMLQWVIYYHAAIDDRIPAVDRNRAKKIRDSDEYWELADRFFRNSLVKFYPELPGVEATVTIDELEHQIPARKELEKRYASWIYSPSLYSQTVSLRDFSSSHPQYHFHEEKIQRQNGLTIQGKTVFSGDARGLVRLIRRKDQVSQLKEGEILVSPMTTPDFIPAIQKAAAIVTDEGGILCHAAVVAREMKKICIVGTQWASQAFRDGDEVQVNGENGTIRLIRLAQEKNADSQRR